MKNNNNPFKTFLFKGIPIEITIKKNWSLPEKKISLFLKINSKNTFLINILRKKNDFNFSFFANLKVDVIARKLHLNFKNKPFYKRNSTEQYHTRTAKSIDRIIRPFFKNIYNQYQIIIIPILVLEPINIIDPSIFVLSTIINFLEKKELLFSSCSFIQEKNSLLFDALIEETNCFLRIASDEQEKIIEIEFSSNGISETRFLQESKNLIQLNNQLLQLQREFLKELKTKLLNFSNNDNNQFALKLKTLKELHQHKIVNYFNQNSFNTVFNLLKILKIKEELIKLCDELFSSELNENIPNKETQKPFFLKILHTLIKEELKKIYFLKKNRLNTRKFQEKRLLSLSFFDKQEINFLIEKENTKGLFSLEINNYNTIIYPFNYYNFKEIRPNFIIHYNFPSFSVNEINFRNKFYPNRREISHSFLIKTTFQNLIPKSLSYYIKIVIDIIQSDGSSSMLSVIGVSLILKYFLKILKKTIVGISLGCISNQNTRILIVDLDGNEDIISDFDFKITSNSDNQIFSLQLDIKKKIIDLSLLKTLLKTALIQNQSTIKEIEQQINKQNIIEVKNLLPKSTLLKIEQNKIALLIGLKGINIKTNTQKNKVDIDLLEEGFFKITYFNEKNFKNSLQDIKKLIPQVIVIPLNIKLTGIIQRQLTKELFLIKFQDFYFKMFLKNHVFKRYQNIIFSFQLKENKCTLIKRKNYEQEKNKF